MNRPLSQPTLCFILGIQRRSGTNYLSRLLNLHPNCTGPGPVAEDFLLHHSDLLRQYVNRVYAHYDPRWEVEGPIVQQERLLELLGDALGGFLKLPFTTETTEASSGPEAASGNAEHKVLLAKTPSVKEIGNFLTLFPGARLLIIVRDGRAVVESGVKSFGWCYETAVHNWACAARTILDLQDTCPDFSEHCLITRYEDLLLSTEPELLRIFAWLGLDPEPYDFSAAQSLPVVGSSELKKNKGDQVHWEPVKADSTFNPTARFSHWNRKQHERFNWLAGHYMSRFGY